MEKEYHWYVLGCDRLGQAAVSPKEFAGRWQEFEAHAEQLKTADASGALLTLDATKRADMEARMKDDPFVRALLVGMAEEGVAFSE